MALLAYLATTAPRIHPREDLATLLWPELTLKDAKNNLRVTLARNSADLAAQSEPYVLADRYSVQLNGNAPIWSDVVELQRVLARLVQHPVDTVPMELNALDATITNFGGDFLAGLNLDGCAEFQLWQLETREHYRALVIKLFDLLAERHQRAGQLLYAESLTRRVLEIDALHEPAHRRLMKLLALQDLRHAAIGHFEQMRKLFHIELGILPDSITLSLMEAIEAGNLSIVTGEPSVAQVIDDRFMPAAATH